LEVKTVNEPRRMEHLLTLVCLVEHVFVFQGREQK